MALDTLLAHIKLIILTALGLTYGAIMSLSILKGSMGFHGYLLIYFPMFAPLLTFRRFQINLLLPIGFVVFIETIVLVGK